MHSLLASCQTESLHGAKNKVQVLICLCPVPKKSGSYIYSPPEKMLFQTFIMGYKECYTKECYIPVKRYNDTVIFIFFQMSSYLSSLFSPVSTAALLQHFLKYSTGYENLNLSTRTTGCEEKCLISLDQITNLWSCIFSSESTLYLMHNSIQS